MIKVSFYMNEAEDIISYIEKYYSNDEPVEEWLRKLVPGLSFDCEDFPHDLEQFYDCFFVSDHEQDTAVSLCAVLDSIFREERVIQHAVWITDEALEKKVQIGTVQNLEEEYGRQKKNITQPF